MQALFLEKNWESLLLHTTQRKRRVRLLSPIETWYLRETLEGVFSGFANPCLSAAASLRYSEHRPITL